MKIDNNYDPNLTLELKSSTSLITQICYREKYLFKSWKFRISGYLYQLHRLDGPALICSDNKHEWWYHGEQVKVNSQEKFEKYLKLKAFW